MAIWGSPSPAYLLGSQLEASPCEAPVLGSQLEAIPCEAPEFAGVICESISLPESSQPVQQPSISAQEWYDEPPRGKGKSKGKKGKGKVSMPAKEWSAQESLVAVAENSTEEAAANNHQKLHRNPH